MQTCKTCRTSCYTAPCRHFTPPPSQEPRPSAFSAIRFPLSWPTREDVKRVDSAHRIGSISSSTHIQHSLSTLSSTTPIYPTCQSQSRPSRHRQSLSLNPPHLSLACSLFLRALSLVLGPRAVFVLGCWVACSQFTDLVVYRPSSVASVTSRIAVQDSAIVQQPKHPPVCLRASLCACIIPYATLVHNHSLPAFASCWLAQRCKSIQTQSIVCAISTIRPPPSPALHMHTPQQQADPSTLLSTLRSSSATALVPPDHGALPPFPRHRSCTLPNLAPCAHRPSHQPGSVLATLVCAAASGTSRLRRVR